MRNKLGNTAGAMVAVLSLVAILAGCGEQAVNKAPAQSAQSNERYVMVSNVAANSYWLAAKQGGEDAAAKLGVKFIYTGPANFDTAAQVNTLQQIIAEKPAGIIVPALDPKALTPVINKAAEAGIPVVTIDTDAPASSRLTYLGTNNYSAGLVMGAELGRAVNGNGDIGLATVPGQYNLEQRIQGIKDALKQQYPNVKIVSIVDDKNDENATANAVVAMLEAHPEIKAVSTMNAVGAGLAAALRQTGKVGKVKAVTFDLTAPILKDLQDGTISATIDQRTYMMGYLGVQLLYDYNHKTPYLEAWSKSNSSFLPPTVDTGVFVITSQEAQANPKLYEGLYD